MLPVVHINPHMVRAYISASMRKGHGARPRWGSWHHGGPLSLGLLGGLDADPAQTVLPTGMRPPSAEVASQVWGWPEAR